MLIKIKINLRQEINLNRDYSHSVTSPRAKVEQPNTLSCHLNKNKKSRRERRQNGNAMLPNDYDVRILRSQLEHDCVQATAWHRLVSESESGGFNDSLFN